MAITVTLKVELPDLRLDARKLVETVGDAVAAKLRQDLRGGVDPATGAPKPRKADGKPQGYNTGVLADGIQRGSVAGDETRATTTVSPPPERRAYVESNPDVMTLGGQVELVVQKAMDDYLETR